MRDEWLAWRCATGVLCDCKILIKLVNSIEQ
uniref:Uncharacterized protein n=1 Tax=Rhizophora mucronata TaxID=61149 RepID=A0A2P2J196_RHIMU